MNRKLSCLAGALLAAVPPVVVQAAEERAVVVTATRTAQLADEVLAPMVVITREEIERSQASDLADLLRFRAGFDIGRNGGPGQSTSLFLRGTESNHVMVMIDGVRMNPATIGGAALQNIDPALIERVEVVKGPRSALYGTEAIGGVINVITRRASQGTEANASVAAGSFDTLRFTFGARHAATGGTRLGVDGSAYRTDGFPTFTTSDVDRGHDNRSVNAFLGHRFALLDVELSHYQAKGNTEYLGFSFDPSVPPPPLDQDFENSVTALRLQAEPTSNWVTRLRLSQARDEIDQSQDDDFAHTDRIGLDWQNDVQIGRAHLLTAGIEILREETTAASFGTVFDEERDIDAVYLQDAIEYGAHRGLIAGRYVDYEGFGGHFIWNVEYGYLLTQATRFTVGAGTAFRAPDQTDRFGFGGNPDLEPEESRNVEIGLRHRFSPAQRVALQVFQNDIDNLIEFDFAASGMFNIAEARIRGAEASYEYAAGPWRLAAAATMQDPKSLDSGNQLPRRAKRSATASVSYTADRWQLGTDLLAASNRRDSDFSDAILAGYGLANLTAAVSLGRDWTLRARVENLFDKDYMLADGFRTAERSYLVQLGWRSGGGGQAANP